MEERNRKRNGDDPLRGDDEDEHETTEPREKKPKVGGLECQILAAGGRSHRHSCWHERHRER